MFQVTGKSHGKRSLLLLALLATGVLLAVLQGLYNAGTYIQSFFVPVAHPHVYRFTFYDRLLRDNVKGELVDYRSLQHDKVILQKAIDELKHIRPDRLSGETEKICFWINAYNLLVLKDILDQYPVTYLNRLGNAFSLRNFVIGGKPYSVELIDRREIRPRLESCDRRALFTICDGARGYPPILNHALTPEHFTQDIDFACRRFINNPNNVFIDTDTDTFYLSPFFKWKENLLAGGYGTVFAFANAYLPEERKLKLDNIHLRQSFFVEFNWMLNDTKLGPVTRRFQDGETGHFADAGADDAAGVCTGTEGLDVRRGYNVAR